MMNERDSRLENYKDRRDKQKKTNTGDKEKLNNRQKQRKTEDKGKLNNRQKQRKKGSIHRSSKHLGLLS